MKFQIAPVSILLTLAACGGDAQPQGQNAAPAETPTQQTSSAAGATGASAAAGASANKPAGMMTATKPTSDASAKAGAGGSTASGAAGQAASAPAMGVDVPAAGSGGSATTAAAGSGGAPGAAEPPAVACNPADRTADAMVVDTGSYTDMGGALTPVKGPEMPLVETDPGLKEYTIYRPAMLAEGKKYPPIVWANGGCGKDGLMFARFLLEIASHGFVIVAWGEPNGTGMGDLTTNGVPQTQALDWIMKEAERPCSKYYRKLDTSKIAAMGQSCGGLMTLGVSGDKRLSTVVIWNSGMFDRDQKIYMGLHAPMAYFIGGMDDVAYPQAQDDFAAINTVPVFYGNTPVGHFATYSQANGGEFARVGIGWLKWQLYGDESESGGKMFVGKDCELCKDSKWTVEKKMME